MEKRLEDRSLEELWQLFPIFLVPYKKEWAGWYREEKGRLEVLLGAGRVKRVSHIGSTAVSGIWAKNIIDILLEVPDKKRMCPDINSAMHTEAHLHRDGAASAATFHKRLFPIR